MFESPGFGRDIRRRRQLTDETNGAQKPSKRLSAGRILPLKQGHALLHATPAHEKPHGELHAVLMLAQAAVVSGEPLEDFHRANAATGRGLRREIGSPVPRGKNQFYQGPQHDPPVQKIVRPAYHHFVSRQRQQPMLFFENEHGDFIAISAPSDETDHQGDERGKTLFERHLEAQFAWISLAWPH
jgi:hypothetical protein